MLATRHDLRLGLHRLRLEGELTEIRAADLRFSLAEARALFAGGRGAAARRRRWRCCTSGPRAGRRGCGWRRCRWPGTPIRSGSRPSSPAASGRWPSTCWPRCWSGSGEQVRRLLLRTSILERVNGELADLLTGGRGGERVLAGPGGGERVRGLAGRGAVLVPLPPAVRRPAAAGAAPHRAGRGRRAAPGWPPGGSPGTGTRWRRSGTPRRRGTGRLAARLLADHWPGLHLDGQAATVHELLAGFPAGVLAADAELAAVAAADELAQGSLEAAERYLGLAERGLQAGFGSASVPAGRRDEASAARGPRQGTRSRAHGWWPPARPATSQAGPVRQQPGGPPPVLGRLDLPDRLHPRTRARPARSRPARAARPPHRARCAAAPAAAGRRTDGDSGTRTAPRPPPPRTRPPPPGIHSRPNLRSASPNSRFPP